MMSHYDNNGYDDRWDYEDYNEHLEDYEDDMDDPYYDTDEYYESLAIEADTKYKQDVISDLMNDISEFLKFSTPADLMLLIAECL